MKISRLLLLFFIFMLFSLELAAQPLTNNTWWYKRKFMKHAAKQGSYFEIENTRLAVYDFNKIIKPFIENDFCYSFTEKKEPGFKYGAYAPEVDKAKFVNIKLRRQELEAHRKKLLNEENTIRIEKDSISYYIMLNKKPIASTLEEMFENLGKPHSNYLSLSVIKDRTSEMHVTPLEDELENFKKIYRDLSLPPIVRATGKPSFIDDTIRKIEKSERAIALQGGLYQMLEYYRFWGGNATYWEEERRTKEVFPKVFYTRLDSLLRAPALSPEDAKWQKYIFEKLYKQTRSKLWGIEWYSFHINRENMTYFYKLTNPYYFAEFYKKYAPERVRDLMYEFFMEKRKFLPKDVYGGRIDRNIWLDLLPFDTPYINAYKKIQREIDEAIATFSFTPEQCAELHSMKEEISNKLIPEREKAEKDRERWLAIKREESESRRKYNQEMCAACEIDFSKTVTPRESEGLFDSGRVGKIVMKNGQSYMWNYSNGKYEMDCLFIFSHKEDTYDGMLNHFLKKCKEEYCK